MPTPGRIVTQRPQASIACKRLSLCIVCMAGMLAPAVWAASPSPEISLEQTVTLALKANLSARIAAQQTQAARAQVKARQTEFLPSVSTRYGYTRHEESTYALDPTRGLVRPEEEYQWVTTITQPLFTGFALVNQYQVARMGLDAALLNEALVRRDVVFEAKRIYFLLLKRAKLKGVAQEAVTMLMAQTEVAVNYHEVGMTPLNDLLKTRVELANARQDLVAAENQWAVARANLNLLLRRALQTPVQPQEILESPRLEATLDESLKQALTGRVELTVADLEVEMAAKEVSLVQRDYLPQVQVQGNYYKQGSDWEVDGGPGIADDSFWDVQAQARWDLWQWGRTGHQVTEKKSRLAQARLNRSKLLDEIQREVNQAWLKARESEKNIAAVQAAIDQAREAFRISEAMFKEQMATSTDVLDARTQLSETQTRYYNALYDFQIALAALDRAMGKPSIDIAEVQ